MSAREEGDPVMQAFDRDVPAALRDDLFEAMAEAADSGEGRDNVSIVDFDRIDAVNVRASGFVEIEGREYAFEIESGNRAGTVLTHWGVEEKPFERHEPTRWAVEPDRLLIGRAMETGTCGMLLLKWEALSKRQDVVEAIRAYGYDRHFAPGVVTEDHWRGRLGRLGFVLVDEETAASTRTLLESAKDHART